MAKRKRANVERVGPYPAPDPKKKTSPLSDSPPSKRAKPRAKATKGAASRAGGAAARSFPAICLWNGHKFSQGAAICVDGKIRVCDSDGEWHWNGNCPGG